MPDHGSGEMNPIPSGAGVPSGGTPLPYTLLSPARFAKLFGIGPLHFWGATAVSLSPAVFPTGSSCGDIWPQHDWQNYDQVSREALAYAIRDAEEDIKNAVGFWPAPVWCVETELYPRDFYRTAMMQTRDVRGFSRGILTDVGRIIGGGKRAVTLLGSCDTATASLAYTDDDGDGFSETATITLATTLTSVEGIKVYHAGHSGAIEWEVRPLRSKSISGGTLTIILDSWLLIDPELYDDFPTDEGFTAIDVSTTANFVTSVDVYYEYNDTSDATAVFRWESAEGSCSCGLCGGTGCAVCTETTQDGCLQVRDGENGMVVPHPASYSDGSWALTEYSVCRAPDRVDLYYYAGEIAQDYLNGRTYDPLSDNWAWMIAWIAAARLERPPCSCSRHANFFDHLREDLSASPQGGGSYAFAMDALDNPFGVHRGEVMAWRRVKHLIKKRPRTALI